MQYIRRYYRLAVKRGSRICYTGHRDREPLKGTVIGSKGARLRVRMDPLGDNKAPVFLLHPTWKIEYLPPDTTKAE